MYDRFDIPGYKIFKDGQFVSDVPDLKEYEESCCNAVSFYFGCSYSLEGYLYSNGIKLKNVEKAIDASIIMTNIEMKPAGPFKGTMVVSMRPILKTQLHKAYLLTSQCPLAHGAPVHIGNPARIGISDISSPQWGDPMEIEEGEVPMFWACGCSGFEAVKHAGMCRSYCMSQYRVLCIFLPLILLF